MWRVKFFSSHEKVAGKIIPWRWDILKEKGMNRLDALMFNSAVISEKAAQQPWSFNFYSFQLFVKLFIYTSIYFHYSVNAKKTSLASNKMVAKLVYIPIFTLFLQCEKIYILSNCGLKVIALKGENHLMT